MSNSAAQATANDAATERRRARLSTLARAPERDLLALWRAWRGAAPEPGHEMLRAPETGTVMVRGRAGATGAPFNLGEMTVTRASVRLGDGSVGHGHVQGRSREAARIAALIDALSEAGHADALEAAILGPLRSAQETRRRDRAGKAAATKVEFFTMVRGENA
jgi:alpha-D-ribose 1-methylphosphonate 5-triphosphate synthase subunit PhnG